LFNKSLQPTRNEVSKCSACSRRETALLRSRASNTASLDPQLTRQPTFLRSSRIDGQTFDKQRNIDVSTSLRPKYISFDCYGTLINFQMADLARELFADRIAAKDMQQFTTDFARYRLDEVMGDWRPYDQILCNSVQRTCRRWGIEYRDNEGLKFYNAVPTWKPHADVPDALARLAAEYKLVVFSNAMDAQIPYSVEKLGAPFHRVYTAQQAQAYKPRLRAFEYMIEQLDCRPSDILHVSSSMRYDHLSADDVGISSKVFVSRGHEPSWPVWGCHEIKDLSGLPALVGL
jgi:2-haloacid dehalogenase